MSTFEVTIKLRVRSDGSSDDVQAALEARLDEFYPLDDEVAVPDSVEVNVEPIR